MIRNVLALLLVFLLIKLFFPDLTELVENVLKGLLDLLQRLIGTLQQVA